MKYKLVDTEQIFVDSTHVKVCANSKKMRKRVAHEQALWYEEELQKEIVKDREAHGKKPFKEKKKNHPPSGGSDVNRSKEKEDPEKVKTQKYCTSDPENGWFHKGEHIFAYTVETACDKHGWILGYGIHPENMSMYMMSIMTAIYARKTISCHIIRQTGKDTGNTRAAQKYVGIARIFIGVQKVRRA